MKTSSTTVFIKKPNGRYEEYGEIYDPNVWPHGTHLVIAEPGWVRLKYNIVPAGASNYAVIAAMERARMAMERAMNKAANMEPQARELTPEEKRGYEAWRKCVGDNRPMRFTGVSMNDIIDAGIKALKMSME